MVWYIPASLCPACCQVTDPVEVRKRLNDMKEVELLKQQVAELEVRPMLQLNRVFLLQIFISE
jgi:hypothetical protein